MNKKTTLIFKSIITPLLLLLITSSCTPSYKNPKKSDENTSKPDNLNISNTNYNIIELSEPESVIFPKEMKIYPLSEALNRWNPIKKDITQAEPILRSCLQNQYSSIFIKLSSYKRQYGGFIDQHNHRILWLNAFNSNSFPKWKNQPVFVYDGGESFFTAMIDMDNLTCLNISPHGDA